MKRDRSMGKRFREKIMSSLLCMALLISMLSGRCLVNAAEVPQGQQATEASASVATTEAAATTAATEAQQTTSKDENGMLGKNLDVGITVTKSITGKIGKKTKVSFKLKSGDAATIKLKNVYPVIDSTFPFETSGDAYKVVKAGNNADKQAELSASFSMTARNDISEGYQGVKFIVEYTKTEADGTVADYYVIKTINIYFEEKNTDSAKDDDADDDDGNGGGYLGSDTNEDEEVTAPKLILTGYESDPETIKAGETFKLTIHIQNTSKTTPVCNGKFLIGNEAGSFLPTSGSSAVFVEKIPAGETGDLEIEMKAAADLSQKNYMLVVKGDFDDGNGNNFTSSDNLTIPVYQDVKLGVSDVSMSPEKIGIGSEGSLMFTINNQGGADVYNVKVAINDEAVTGEECYVGNIAAASSAYATLNVVGAKDNSDTGTISVMISFEDSEGNAGKSEEKLACFVGEDVVMDDFEDWDDWDEDYIEESEMPWWLILLIVLAVVIVIVVIVIIVVKKKKKRAAKLLEDGLEDEDESGEDDLDNEDF